MRVYDVPEIRSRSIDRHRLLRVIGEGSTRANLTIVHGFAGSGKSTLLAQWATSLTTADEALLWVTLREDDADSRPFWSRIGEALARNELIDREEIDRLTQPGTDGNAPRRDVLSAIGRRMPLTLVLDDYHAVAAEAIDAELRYLLENVNSLRLVLGTRSTGGLHAIDLAARVSTTLIDASALAFTLEESEHLVAINGMDDDPELAGAIHEATVGWPLASHALIVEAGRDPAGGTVLSRTAGAHPQFVAEFVRATLTRRSATEQDFLLRISLADECTGELASHLTGDSLEVTQRRLDELETDGIGTWQVRSGVAWFRMHPLLREGFEARAMTALQRAVIERIQGQLSDRLLYERPLRALEFAVAISDWDRVEHIFLLRYAPLTYYYRAPSSRILVTLPAAALHERPGLMATQLGTLYGISSTPIEELKRAAAALIGAARKHPITASTVFGALKSTAIMAALRIMGEDSQALIHAEHALRLFERSTAEDKQRHGPALPTLFTQVATTYLVEAQHSRALSVLERAHEVTAQLDSLGETFHVSALTALVHAARGDITAADEWIAACERTGRYDGWFIGYLDSGYHIAKAISALNRWDGDAAREALTTPGTREHVIEFWPYLAIVDARVRLWETGPLDAHGELAATLARKQWRPAPPAPLRVLLTALKTELLLLAGQTSRAEAEARQVANDDQPAALLAQARIALARGEAALALALADRASWAAEDSPRLRSEALLAVASLSVDLGDENRAVENFVAAMSSMQRYGVQLPLLSLPLARIKQLAALAADAGYRVDAAVLDAVPSVTRRVRRIEPLSKAERRVLSMLLSRDVTDTAAALHLSVHTVRYHLKRTYPKLGVNSREDAIMVAQELGLLEDGQEKAHG